MAASAGRVAIRNILWRERAGSLTLTVTEKKTVIADSAGLAMNNGDHYVLGRQNVVNWHRLHWIVSVT